MFPEGILVKNSQTKSDHSSKLQDLPHI